MRPTPFAVSHDRHGDVHVVAVTGELDLATAPELAAVLEHARHDGARETLVDLGHTAFMDSTGLRTLIGAAQDTVDGARFSIVCPDGAVRRVLDLSGAESFLVLHDDRATGLRWHRDGAGPDGSA